MFRKNIAVSISIVRILILMFLDEAFWIDFWLFFPQKLEEDKISLMYIEKEVCCFYLYEVDYFFCFYLYRSFHPQLNQKCDEKENELFEVKKQLMDVKAIGKGREEAKPLEKDDSGWRSTPSPDYAIVGEMEPTDREEVTVAPTVVVKAVSSSDDGSRATKPGSYYLFDGRSFREDAANEDFDSALSSEMDSDTKGTSSWRYPNIPPALFKRRSPNQASGNTRR